MPAKQKGRGLHRALSSFDRRRDQNPIPPMPPPPPGIAGIAG
jgi:hypothetical protein